MLQISKQTGSLKLSVKLTRLLSKFGSFTYEYRASQPIKKNFVCKNFFLRLQFCEFIVVNLPSIYKKKFCKVFLFVNRFCKILQDCYQQKQSLLNFSETSETFKHLYLSERSFFKTLIKKLAIWIKVLYRLIKHTLCVQQGSLDIVQIVWISPNVH